MLRNKIQGLEATDPDFPQLSLAERRQKLRVRTYIRLTIKGQDGELNQAIAIDISTNGLRVRSKTPLAQDSLCEVVLEDEAEEGIERTLACRVVWSITFGPPGHQAYEAGLTLSEETVSAGRTWLSFILDQMGFDQSKTFQKRRYLRAEGQLPARVFTHGREGSIEAEVVNLGIGGALLASAERLEKDNLIHCELCLWRILPALRLPCRVVAVREDGEAKEGEARYLHSLIFLAVDTEQVKLLGNYVIHMVNQSSE